MHATLVSGGLYQVTEGCRWWTAKFDGPKLIILDERMTRVHPRSPLGRRIRAAMRDVPLVTG